ncbi:hypothetical protein SNEBB_009554 [Seison nebaliae]|nr:hypothetical protein SNEBB_009554 [Seison nebaliae]
MKSVYIIFIHLIVFALTKDPVQNLSDQCFCKLNGNVDDCDCRIDLIDQLNLVKIFPRMESLLKKDYFRYFKVNLNKKCPYWTDDSTCVLKDCHVKLCKENEVPTAVNNCQDELEEHLGKLNPTVNENTELSLKEWEKYEESKFDFCEIDDKKSTNANFVDLLLNPERYTGYAGPSAHRIWRSIYEENCFKSPDDKKSHQHYALLHPSVSSKFTESCLEKRVFYRLISGLHTSINIHLSRMHYKANKKNQFLNDINNKDEMVLNEKGWNTNVDEFIRRFSKQSTEKGPQYLKNLYFTYLVVLRAMNKASPYFRERGKYTGIKEIDQELQTGINSVLDEIDSFKYHFNESNLFTENSEEMKLIKDEFRNKFRNITTIMDCVGCDKCRLWGKLQTTGLGTALKILFTNNIEKLNLRRMEIVALWNGFGRLSKSVDSIPVFKKLIEEKENNENTHIDL